MSTESLFDETLAVQTIEFSATGFPPAQHPAEADLFARQALVPGYDQRTIEAAHVGLVGAGGLGSWIGLGLARAGVREMTIFDADRFDRTNSPRQLMFGIDLGRPKAQALAENLTHHMLNPGVVRGVPEHWTAQLGMQYDCDILVVGVDNNRARLGASAWGIANAKPVVFAMLSTDGLRAQAFLQRPGSACLQCVLPDLAVDTVAPCAAASFASCILADAHAIYMTIAALSSASAPVWRETSLDGTTERALSPSRRASCKACSSEK